MRRPQLTACIFVSLISVLSAHADRTVLLDDLTFPGRWQLDLWNKAPGQATLDTDTPPGTTDVGSLKVMIAWPAGDEFRFFSVAPKTPRGPIPYRLKEIALWVKADGDPHFFEIHFKDAKGADQKVGWTGLTHHGWLRLTKAIPQEWAQPLTFTSVTWHNWGMKDAGVPAINALARIEGTVDDAQRLVPGEDKAELLLGSASPHGIADQTGKCDVALRLLCWGGENRTVTVSGELLDAEGRVLKTDKADIALTGDHPARIRHDLPRNGCYAYVVSLAEKGSAAGQRGEARLVRLDAGPPLTDQERLASSIGVNTHLGAPWAAFEAIGIHWARDYSWGWLGHGDTAPVGNGRDFAALVAEATAHHVNILPITQAGFRNKAETGFLEDSAAITTGFERLSRALPQLPYWEIDNEYEYALRDKGFDMADYERALQAAAAGLKRAGRAQLVPNGTAGIRADQAKALLASPARDTISVINSHYYTGTTPPELSVTDANFGGDQRHTPLSMLDQLKQISDLAHAAGKESWLSEIGWDVTNGPAVGEKLQAIYLPRAYLLARLSGVDKIHWFYDRDVPNATGIFSTCGLIRLDGSIRPSGVAMAALSRETARATIAGSLDLGEDIWAVILRQPDGAFALALWSVLREHPLPKQLAGVPAFDIFGNPAKPERITPSVLYFRLAKLPPEWDLQRQARWDSLSTLVASPAGEVEARASGPVAAVAWEKLPEGVTSAGWLVRDGKASATLRLAPAMAAGRFEITAAAKGDGFTRTWPITLVVEPALTVTGLATYEPSQPQLCTVASTQFAGRVTARIVGDNGIVAPANFPVSPDKPRQLAVIPSDTAVGTLQLELAAENGLKQTVTLFPARLSLPYLANATPDTDLKRWPASSLCPSASADELGREAPLRLHLAWAPGGLVFAAALPAAGLKPGNPSSFWDSTNVELFVDPAAGQRWSGSTRQFWLAPTRQGERWGVTVGQWLRGDKSGPVPETRLRTVIAEAIDSVVISGFVPAEALGRAPAAGEIWRIAISARAASDASSPEAAWPRLKSAGLTNGPSAWGTVTFTGGK